MNSSPSNINLPHSELGPECQYHKLLLLLNVIGKFLGSPIMTSSPFPSHPTRRSVFPNPAVRQSSSHGMRRLSLVPDDSAPDVDHPPGVQSRIRVFLPPKASAFTAIVQIPTKASVDKSLQVPKSVARICVAIVIHPSPHRLIHLLYKLRGLDRCPPLGEAFDPSADVAL